LFTTGVSVGRPVRVGSAIMLGTAVTYLFIQVGTGLDRSHRFTSSRRRMGSEELRVGSVE
jgi:hypothetical protein